MFNRGHDVSLNYQRSPRAFALDRCKTHSHHETLALYCVRVQCNNKQIFTKIMDQLND